MPWYDVTPEKMMDSCRLDWATKDRPEAYAYVEAENVARVWEVVQEWYEAMESGDASDRYPDPDWTDPPGRRNLTQELADAMILEMDADFDLEKNRYPDGRGPEFKRLPAHARLAFAQQLRLVMKSPAEIEQETRERLAKGEPLPPRPRAAHPPAPDSTRLAS